MRIFARRERPHPGAQLTLFEAGDGWRYTLWVTSRPAATGGCWLKLLALDGTLGKAEPKTLRYRIPHAAPSCPSN